MLISLGAMIEIGWATMAATFVNPLDLDYRMRPEAKARYRECADPEIIFHANRYWLFASKCGGYYVSDDLARWRYVVCPALPVEEWAPTVEEIGGRLYFSARGGTIHRAVDPATGKWETLDGRLGGGAVDSALFRDEDGRLYNYWGWWSFESLADGTKKGEGDRPLRGVELDPLTFQAKGSSVDVLRADLRRYGWEARGNNNELGNATCGEGAHMIRRGDRYYLQYAGPGTQYDTYCDGALIGPSPLGPFVRQALNPFSLKTHGYARGAGHGKTFRDRHGNYWHVTTCVVAGGKPGFNRRLVMFPVFFDADGEMWCDTAFADAPICIPDHRTENPSDYVSGLMPLCPGGKVVASSGRDAAAVADGDLRTYWIAESGRAGEFAGVEFGFVAETRAVQIGFCEGEEWAIADAWRNPKATRRFRVEGVDAEGRPVTLLAETELAGTREQFYFTLEKPCRLRSVKVVNCGLPAGERFALREIRAFGRGEIARPAAVTGLVVRRDAADRRHATVSWDPAPGAQGYLLRYGPASDKQHLSRLVTGACSVEMRGLDAARDYHWTISAYNAAGFSAGRDFR